MIPTGPDGKRITAWSRLTAGCMCWRSDGEAGPSKVRFYLGTSGLFSKLQSFRTSQFVCLGQGANDEALAALSHILEQNDLSMGCQDWLVLSKAEQR
eukprot:756210-Hanusia_phi.AAC.1